MVVRSKITILCYCFATIACFVMYGMIAINYDDHLLSNSMLFLVWGILLLGYIPWTIWGGISDLKRTKQNSRLVVALTYAIFLLLLFFGELTKYLNYVEIIGHIF